MGRLFVISPNSQPLTPTEQFELEIYYRTCESYIAVNKPRLCHLDSKGLTNHVSRKGDHRLDILVVP
jgi:hypothetical protein